VFSLRFRGGLQGSVGRTSPIAGTKCASLRCWDHGTRFSPLGSACAGLRWIGVRLSIHGRRFASFRNLAAPFHMIQGRHVVGCWSFIQRPVRARLLALFGLFASVRHRPGGYSCLAYVALFRRCFGALPSPCRSDRSASRKV
jgi:hypothetical protein